MVIPMNKRRFSVATLMFFALSFINTYAQPDIQVPKSPEAGKSAIGINDAVLIDQMMFVMPGVGSNARELLTEQSIKAYMMPARRQEPNGSSIAYTVASALEYYVNLKKNYKDNLSPDYISLNLASNRQDMTFQEAFKFLIENGTVSAAIMPYGASSISPAVYATPKFGIQNFLFLFHETTKGRQKIFETRKALMRGHPVVLEMRVDPGFEKLRQVRYWAPPTTTGDSDITTPVVVVSYDEDLEAFEILTSLGSEWGEGGYIWVNYADFEKYALDGFVILPNPTK